VRRRCLPWCWVLHEEECRRCYQELCLGCKADLEGRERRGLHGLCKRERQSHISLDGTFIKTQELCIDVHYRLCTRSSVFYFVFIFFLLSASKQAAGYCCIFFLSNRCLGVESFHGRLGLRSFLPSSNGFIRNAASLWKFQKHLAFSSPSIFGMSSTRYKKGGDTPQADSQYSALKRLGHGYRLLTQKITRDREKVQFLN